MLSSRPLAIAMAILRILIAFAFLPAGLKKLLGQPFTDPTNTGRFHDFLHAFHATGWFYNAVGVIQLAAAALLFSQRFALAGAAIALPVFTAITLLCWSTLVVPTAIVATLLLLGTLAVLLYERVPSPIDLTPWRWCGIAIAATYLGYCLAVGEVYRPRGARPDEPGFYLFPILLAMPLVTLALERFRAGRARALGGSSRSR